MKRSKLYCESHSDDIEFCGYLDAGIDARPTCSADLDCASSSAAPYCEPTQRVCVECYQQSHCVDPAESYCDVATFSCKGCVTHGDCASEVCLPDGTCAGDNVAYVDPTAAAANTACTLAEKCNTIAKALATMKPYIKLQGAIAEGVAIVGRTVTLLADPGTTLTHPATTTVLTIENSSVSVSDLTIVGNSEKGILVKTGSTARLTRITVTECDQHDKRAIDVQASTLILTRSNIVGNAGGGIITDPASMYQITNTFLVRNGENTGAVGGVLLEATAAGFNRFEMNTVVDNIAKTGAVGGVDCRAAINAANNLIARNATPTLSSNTQTLGGCSYTGTQQSDTVAEFAFVMPDGNGPWDYHVRPGSMAVDRGIASDITLDVDGQPRPHGTQVDVGADEYMP